MNQENDTRPLMVSISCLTYNHEPYIRQCLEGFVMQKTNFRFEAIVHDDASTDGTAVIIREYAEKYPDIIKPIFETENQYSKHDRTLGCIMDEACKGKYIAFCEGDDCWTDPNKIQKQVDILEKDLSVTLVHSAFQCVDDNNNPIKREQYEWYMKESKSGDVFERLLQGPYILTCTVCIRRSVIDSEIYKKCSVLQDSLIFLTAAALGKVIYLPQKTACYRMHQNSATMLYMDKVVANSRYIRHYFYATILERKLVKYSLKETMLLRYKSAVYACNRYRRNNDKEPFQFLRKISFKFYLYLGICIVIKTINRIRNVICNRFSLSNQAT